MKDHLIAPPSLSLSLSLLCDDECECKVVCMSKPKLAFYNKKQEKIETEDDKTAGQ